MKKVLAVIPARGGSKRIPKKNIKDFFGKPLITYSIQAAIDSKLFDKIIVSTDDKEIAKKKKKNIQPNVSRLSHRKKVFCIGYSGK